MPPPMDPAVSRRTLPANAGHCHEEREIDARDLHERHISCGCSFWG